MIRYDDMAAIRCCRDQSDEQNERPRLRLFGALLAAHWSSAYRQQPYSTKFS